MKVAIMQPYFFPYIGYFQLINSVDEFIVYDNIQYTKKGWINRNRMLENGKDSIFSIPLKHDSDYLNVDDRFLSDDWNKWREKLLNRVNSAYKKSPYFEEGYNLFEICVQNKNYNLFQFIFTSLIATCKYLGIKTPLLISSCVNIDHSLRSRDKVVALCKSRNANTYINPIGGMELYKREDFKKEGIDLFFCKAKPFEYPQFKNNFVPWLSILDVIMFNSQEKIKGYLNNYELL